MEYQNVWIFHSLQKCTFRCYSRQYMEYLNIWLFRSLQKCAFRCYLRQTLKNVSSIETFDFSTLYKNVPLDVIYDNLRSLITKMFANSKYIFNMINSNRKKRTYWPLLTIYTYHGVNIAILLLQIFGWYLHSTIRSMLVSMRKIYHNILLLFQTGHLLWSLYSCY